MFPKERKKERRKERRKERKKDGSSGLPSYCTPLVCVPYVLGALAVWRQNIKRKIFLLWCCVFVDVCFVLFLLCFYICVCVCLHIQGPLRECHSIRSGDRGPSYYCAPLVCVPAVIGVPAVWQHYKPKTKSLTGLPGCSIISSCREFHGRLSTAHHSYATSTSREGQRCGGFR